MLFSIRLTATSLQSICKRFAGHSKWQNIRHTKNAKDTERSQLFIKLGQKIKIAIRETGNPDPVTNIKLQQALETAKVKHMPAGTIKSFITQAKNDGDKSQILYFDLKGPKGSFFIVEAITDTPIKTKNEIQSISKRYSLSVLSSLRNQFNHKGVVVAKPRNDFQNIEELSVEHAIESGAEDVEYVEEENFCKFICDPKHIKGVSDKLKDIGYEIEDADDHFLPLQTVVLEDIYLESLGKVFEKLIGIPGVVKIYDNIA